MTSKPVRILRTTLLCLLLVAAGVAGGYAYATETDESDNSEATATATTERGAQDERERVLSMTQEVCVTASELESAYTRAVIGHSERCREAGNAGESGQWAAVLGEICTDIRKATRTAHLPDADCPGVKKAERVKAPAEDKAASAKVRKR